MGSAMKNVWKYLIGLSFVMLLATSANAVTYKYMDQEGRTVYSQHPPASGPYTVIDTPKTNKYGADSKSSTNPKSNKPSLKDRVSEISEKNKQNSDITAETEKNKKLREDNCKNARKNLEVYQVYRRFKDDKGNVTRISDADRQKKIDEARDAIKQFCD